MHKTTDPRLPRADEAEKYLIQCLVRWPERADEILPLCKSTDFFEPLHQQLWRVFTRQNTIGGIDATEAGRKCDCSYFLLELGFDAVTSVHAESRAKMVREAAKARAVHDVCQRAADAILRGRSAESTLASLRIAIEAFEGVAVA